MDEIPGWERSEMGEMGEKRVLVDAVGAEGRKGSSVADAVIPLASA